MLTFNDIKSRFPKTNALFVRRHSYNEAVEALHGMARTVDYKGNIICKMENDYKALEERFNHLHDKCHQQANQLQKISLELEQANAELAKFPKRGEKGKFAARSQKIPA